MDGKLVLSATAAPDFVTEATATIRQYGNFPLYTLTIKQLESVFKTWIWQLSQPPPKSMEPERYLTRSEVAKILNLSLPTLTKYCELGLITARKVGTRYLFSPEEVAAAVEKINTNTLKR